MTLREEPEFPGEFDCDHTGCHGPQDEDIWIVEALYEAPLPKYAPKNVMSADTCHILIERYDIPEKHKFYFQVEEEQYRNRKALYAEKFGPMDQEFDYREIWKSPEYQEYKSLSNGPAERFKELSESKRNV